MAGVNHTVSYIPILPGSEIRFLTSELVRISQSFAKTVAGPTESFHVEPITFRRLFTSSETGNIWTSNIAGVRIFLYDAAGSAFVNLQEANTSAFLDLLVSNSLIASSRKAEVLAGQLKS